MAVKKNNIKDHVSVPTEGFVTWKDGDADSLAKAQEATWQALASIQPVFTGGSGDSSVRVGMDRYNYELFRPNERTPRGRRDILCACNEAYERVSPIKNIIDMMVDFTTEGIRPVHPNTQVELFYQNWWKKVGGTDRSQHFINNFYLHGVAIVKRNTAKLSAKVVEEVQRGRATADSNDSNDYPVYDFQPTPQNKPPKNVIPWSYDFLNPVTVLMLGGELAVLAGMANYGVEIPAGMYNIIRSPRSAYDHELVGSLPEYITNTIRSGSNIIKIDPSKLIVSHYKKQDWQMWSYPLLYSVMDDLILLQKMRLTDLAALDGAISHIRIWKLGSLEHRIMPTKAIFDKLNEVLQHAGNGQSLDLMWGPDLTLEETSSDLQKYLGEAKYIPVLSSLYAGLGVPPSLVGGSGAEGFTNNFLSLKTLIERLNYGRDALVKFWEKEMSIVQQAMGFRFPAKIEFKNTILTDETAYNSLLIDLLDRNVISIDRVREHMGYIPEVEEAAIKKEYRARQAKKIPPKASPFHDAEVESQLTKIFAQTGVVTPSQVGIDLEKPKNGEKPLIKMNQEVKTKPGATPQSDLKKGQQGEGRPQNSKDIVKRKKRKPKIRTASENPGESINLMTWATSAQEKLSSVIHPVYLKMNGKKDMRSLTSAQVEDVEHLKFVVLCTLEPYTTIDETAVASIISNPLPVHEEANNFWKLLVSDFMQKNERLPSIDEIHQIQSYIYALYNTAEYGEDDEQY